MSTQDVAKWARWVGLVALIAAFATPALGLPGAQYLAPWLVVLAVGCWVFLLVHYFRYERPRKQRGDQPGTDSSR